MRLSNNRDLAIYMAYFASTGGGGSCSGSGQTFNGTDEYLYYADNGALDINQATTDFCLSAKLTTGDDITTMQRAIGKLVPVATNGSYGFTVIVGVLRAYVFTSDGQFLVNDNITAATGTEYHLLLHIDITNSNIYYYIDGVLQNAGGTAFTGTFGTMANDYQFRVGCATDNSPLGDPANFFGGAAKDVRVYHKDVSGDLTKLQNGEILGDEKVWYCLSNYNYNDLSGNGRTLTGVNLPPTPPAVYMEDSEGNRVKDSEGNDIIIP